MKNNLKVRQPLRQILVPVLNEKIKEELKSVEDIILEEINVKELTIVEGDSDIIVKKAKPNFKSIGPKFGKDVKKIQQLIISLTKNEINEIESAGEIVKEQFTITKDDIEVYTENIEGWIVESSGAVTIALDTKLDEELIEEGTVREFISRIQNYRKSNDFNIDDRIKIGVKTSSKIQFILIKNFVNIAKETGCSELTESGDSAGETYKTVINEEACELQIEKILN